MPKLAESLVEDAAVDAAIPWNKGELMGSVYPRGNKLYVGYRTAAGAWKYAATGLDVGREKDAQKILTKIETRVAAGIEHGGRDLGPITLKSFGEQWTKARMTVAAPASRKADFVTTFTRASGTCLLQRSRRGTFFGWSRSYGRASSRPGPC